MTIDQSVNKDLNQVDSESHLSENGGGSKGGSYVK